MTTPHLSRLALEQLAAGELVAGAEHARTCPRCGERLAALERDAAAFAQNLDLPKAMAALEAAVSPEPPAWYARRSVISSAAVFAACAVVFAVFARRAPGPELGERRKGAVGLEVIVRDLAGRVHEVAPGDLLHPQEAIRFRVSAAQPGTLTILGIDAAQAVTPYVSALAVEPGPPLLVDGSIILDDTLGAERIVAIVCDRPEPLAQLIARARLALARSGGDPRQIVHASMGCRETALVIEKAAP